MTYATIIPFDSGDSYIVRSLPIEEKNSSKPIDILGRTKQDREFLIQFVKIFNAANLGDLKTCQKVIKEGFCDLNAYRYFAGKVDASRMRLNNVTPVKMAEMQGHLDIVEYFHKVSKSISKGKQKQTSYENLNEHQLKRKIKKLKKKEMAYQREIAKLKDQIEQIPEKPGPSKIILNLYANDLAEAMCRSVPDEELCDLVKQVVIHEEKNTLNNPLDYIINHQGENPEIAVQRMALIYPVTTIHLENALSKSYSPKTMQLMLQQACIHQDVDTKECLPWLFCHGYPEKLIRLFIMYASEIEFRHLPKAFKLNFSLKTIEILVDKIPELEDEIWNYIFPETHSMLDFFEEQLAKFKEGTEDDLLPPRFFDLYWEHFKDKPKPYLPHLTPFPNTFIRKVIHKCPALSFDIGRVLGQVDEEMLWFLLKQNISVLPLHFEHVLLYGYSDKLVLYLFERFKKGELSKQALKIARLRHYSQEVIHKLEKNSAKCYLM